MKKTKRNDNQEPKPETKPVETVAVKPDAKPVSRWFFQSKSDPIVKTEPAPQSGQLATRIEATTTFTKRWPRKLLKI